MRDEYTNYATFLIHTCWMVEEVWDWVDRIENGTRGFDQFVDIADLAGYMERESREYLPTEVVTNGSVFGISPMLEKTLSDVDWTQIAQIEAETHPILMVGAA